MEKTIHKSGALRGDKILYEDGVGYCVWYPIEEQNDDFGICFDISGDDIDDLIDLLNVLKNATPDVFEE